MTFQVFTKMSAVQRIRTTHRWIRSWFRVFLRSFRKRKDRFVVLTPALLSHQAIYDRKNKRLIQLKIRGLVDFSVIQQIFENNDYGFEKLPRCNELQAYYDKLISEKSTPLILDCGANSGMATRFFAETYPLAHIVSIEPDKENLELAKTNNASKNVSFLLAGVGNTDMRGTIQDPGRGNWSYRINENENGSVKIVSINSILAEVCHEKTTPFIVKIDIEGFEANLFAKNTEWLDKFPILIIELHDWMLPKSGSSNNFLREISKLNRDFLLDGENVFSVSNTLTY